MDKIDHQILTPLATLLCLVISGCDDLGQQIGALTGEQDKQVQALIERTKAQMVFVEGGSFMMGDGGGPNNLPWTIARDNKPAHKVTLTSYSMGAYEVSYGDFDLYTAVNDLPRTMWTKWDKDEIWRAPEFPAGVSWYGAKNYCFWLAELTQLPFDLPTEAQWEFAARNRGENILFATDNGWIEEGRNYELNTDYAEPSGTYPPNPLGFYDLSGNMIEWVNDWWAEDYYQHSPELDPKGPSSGTKKVRRGGMFLESPRGSNVYIRQESEKLEKAYRVTGFRCALNQAKPLSVQSVN
ncbi:formylglycine-generating enzyme family protein [Pseudoalteromonas sp. L23]|uniref:formylglycine-generating enzyme family protein n=1 Tax=unclassified Pseudoalteromonas TaxID=194690 RepID=UPI001EEF862E|nr:MULTISPECIES: SUMF1/EgtB/PvdO family nonheme iron enzyme [unclassified Pseudoalteromonas]MCF7513521.1 formylglycine-generating enzyme family protein [Pseudoalteromonas sp. L7]MCF7525502.1 formylglycine-generating enzyme family protein [Pseudoalteromonas sp. L23]MCX2765985.1 SUMF1/EgtB/PvdO family nonheme iron enzyme [Pseudoalteromonas sp. B530]